MYVCIFWKYVREKSFMCLIWKKIYKIDVEVFVNNNSYIRNENNIVIFKKNYFIFNVRLVYLYIIDR